MIVMDKNGQLYRTSEHEWNDNHKMVDTYCQRFRFTRKTKIELKVIS